MLPAHLAEAVRRQILYYLQSTFDFRDREVERAFERFLIDGDTGLFKGPWVQLQRPFRPAPGGVEPPFDIPIPFHPFVHQWRSWQRLTSKSHVPRPTIVTTGTGSGKTECFLYPILDHCLRARRRGQAGIKAIVLYPMNALAADQERRIAKAVFNDPALSGAGIRVGNYTGRFDPADPGSSLDSGTRRMGPDHGISNHEAQQKDPPDILLTNYKMLDFLLMRPQDQALWRYNEPGVLAYLVMDELHTYDGAQGADVACLVRRLKERLEIPRGELCVVGTSATLDSRAGDTLGDGMETGLDRLARFASTLFEEDIPADAVIPEDRLEVEEIVRAAAREIDIPDPGVCEPLKGEDALNYARRQAEVWNGPRFEAAPETAPEEDHRLASDAWALALGEWLKELKLFRHLLIAFRRAEHEGPLEWDRLIEGLGRAELGFQKIPEDRRDAVAVSLFAMVAQAKERRSGAAFPLVPTQVQIWIRELRRLGRVVSAEPTFAWLDEIPQGIRALPAFHCSECGESGWIAVHDIADDTLIHSKGVEGLRVEGEATEIYNRWFRDGGRHDQHIVVISPWNENSADDDIQPSLSFGNWYLCPGSLVIRRDDGPCPLTGDARRFRVRIDRKTQADQNTGNVFGIQGCPSCGSRDGIFIIGSQAATLSSVAIDELFGSVLNSDPKLLAFTDSVQDASHRAGFFSARTYNFSLRTALQHVVDAAGGPGVSLEGVGRTLLEWWSDSHPGWNGHIRRAMAAFIPPDLREYSEWVTYREDRSGVQPSKGLVDDIAERISWQIVSEFGVMEQHGRSLELSAAAALEWDEDRMMSAVGGLAEHLEGIDPSMAGIDTETLRLWAFGLLHRFRMKGALGHPYISAAAKSFWGRSSRGRTIPGRELFPPRGRFVPRLMVTRPDRNHENVLGTTSGMQAPWHIVWSRRVFRRRGIDETVLLDVIDRFLIEGARAGLLERVHQDGAKRYYAIAAGAARIVPGGQPLKCSVSGRVIVRPEPEAKAWIGAPSLEYYAEGGVYHPVDPSPRQRYYRDRYRKGALRRVVAEEHTGLLTTEERERVESLFSSPAPLPDDPNVLTCTSTLEMGIDIGDLSSTMLCSIPPSTASYLQRIGRAGRATGTALIVTVINQKPHDLFFYARPDEMLRGRVDPPGCWLDASAVLVRQYLAFCFDCAVGENILVEMPSSARRLVQDLEAPGGHIPAMMAWVASMEDHLRASFLARFASDIQDDTRERFYQETSAELLLQRIHKAAHEFDRARKDIENARKRLKEQLTGLDVNEDEARKEIEREEKILRGRSTALSRTSALEILTDHGLLPNYAFPERGVRFYGAVHNRHRSNSEEFKPVELTRSAKAALKELAPANHFYTHSRVFDIQQVAIGSKNQPLVEEWAVCAACGHMRLAEDFERPTAPAGCPQCLNPTAQADLGQRRRFVEFSRSQALSFMEHYESLAGDRSDERQREFYNVVRSFDLTLDEPSGAVGEESLPFGIEYRASTILREVNTGYLHRPGSFAFGPGQTVSEEGFRVCLDCGIVLGPQSREDEARIHRRSCSGRRRHEKLQQQDRKGNPYRWESVYLYRQLRSEALRILLPLVDDEDLETLTACIYLGLRLRFEGNPANLKVIPHRMPGTEGGPDRFYLVIMDEVPGGTGYLKTLYQEADQGGRLGEGVMDLLRRAKSVLENCPCRRSTEIDDRDGCYRCIRAYHLQYRSDKISRERGISLLGRLIEAGQRREEIERLEAIKPDSLIESVLEMRFLQELQAWVEQSSGQWEQTIIKGARGYRFRVSGSPLMWEIELQPVLGVGQGVMIPCRPDFLLSSDDDEVSPIAVFTDGFEFHCTPHNRLADDMVKRRSILESGVFKVWSITWDDLKDSAASDVFVCPTPVVNKMKTFAEARRRDGLRIPDVEGAVGCGLHQLLAYLTTPSPEGWKETAGFVSGWPLELLAAQRVVHGDALASSLEPWRVGGQFTEPPESEGGVWVYNNRTALNSDVVACLRLEHAVTSNRSETVVLARLSDDSSAVEAEDFKERWRHFLAVMNLYQFHGRFFFWATSEVDHETAPEIPLSDRPSLTGEWIEVIEDVVGGAKWIATALAGAGFAAPLVGYELPGSSEDAVAEMAWPDHAQPVAVLAGEQESLVALWRDRGWIVFRLTEIGANGSEALESALAAG